MRCAQFHHRAKLTARRLGRRSLRGESCGSRSLARFREQPLLDSVDRAQCTQLSHVDHPGSTNMTTVRLLVVSESTSTSSTVGCHCELAQIGTLGVAEGEPGMESGKFEHNVRCAVAGATRMPSDGTDDDEVRERGVVP